MKVSADLLHVYTHEHSRLQRLVRRIIGNAAAAEDAVQDAVLKLQGREFDRGDVGLLIRTAQNVARDMLRSEKVRAAYADRLITEQLVPGSIAPDDALASRQELDELMKALEKLPERTRRVFLMSKVDEMTYPDIARTLGVSVSTVEKEMVSALEFCRLWKRDRG